MNVFSFTGNLGRDAETRQAGSGTVASFSVAVSAGYGERKQTIWVRCSLWGKRAESGLIQYLKKGQTVAVSGELSTSEHNGKTYVECRVNDITLVGKREDSEPVRSAPAAQPAPVQQQAAPVMDDIDDSIPF